MQSYGIWIDVFLNNWCISLQKLSSIIYVFYGQSMTNEIHEFTFIYKVLKRKYMDVIGHERKSTCNQCRYHFLRNNTLYCWYPFTRRSQFVEMNVKSPLVTVQRKKNNKEQPQKDVGIS